MMKKLQIMGMATVLSLTSLIAQAKNITAQEFAKLSPKEAVELSHSWHKKNYASVAITSTEIKASFPNEKTVSIPLGDEFFISVAPYEKQTHECDFHVPTGCTGEMINKKMHLKITNQKTGEVIKDEKVQIQKDGFLDLWLPRDTHFIFEFTYKGKKATEVLGTFKNDRTCITTMQLL